MEKINMEEIDERYTTMELIYSFENQTHAIPDVHSKLFQTLYHGTTIEEALTILSTGEISGDSGLHANFAIMPRPDIAKSSEVFLMFEFAGHHRAAISWVGKERLYFTKCTDNVVYHIYTTGSELDTDSGFLDNYWQSIIFPETKGLKFLGLHEPVNKSQTDLFTTFVGKEIAIKGLDSQSHFKEIPTEFYEAAQATLTK
ncbi:hypothetical protein CWB63_10735 [Pseudoalteromonas sp. S409]|nr:hypothetical protein CWB64_10605 [Pseudoalteromonas sp. S410]TMN98412.1 hypothetical protein CWB61_06975 [Pseudoalteromonas sp. S407]TMN98858.1 hypothetical protein CWB63_10735 [Pseudoalteromonas sp. S409]TMO09618.1 hypothetical protein CWB57_11560 [Pseudoalteromonas sp. S186]TMO13531.1 hypothetical protein CWB56_16495 [Pseudoalteromonas sp. S185]